MNNFLCILLLSIAILSGCAAPSPYAKNCINTTPSMSAARWTCLQGESAQGNAGIQQPVQQAPAYDWSSAPTPGSMTPSVSGGNKGPIKLNGMPDPNRPQQINPMSKVCTPNGSGGYVCQ